MAKQAYCLSSLPVIDAVAVGAAAAGDTILVTGVLSGNTPLLEDSGLVAYTEDNWEVTVLTSEDGDTAEPHGTWKSVATVVPELTLDLNGQPVLIREATNVRLVGILHESIVMGDGANQARHAGQLLSDGSQCFRGLADSNLTTVLGQKAASGGVILEEIFAGDRVPFKASQQQAASGLLFSGICSMILSSVVLVGGLLASIWRRR